MIKINESISSVFFIIIFYHHHHQYYLWMHTSLKHLHFSIIPWSSLRLQSPTEAQPQKSGVWHRLVSLFSRESFACSLQSVGKAQTQTSWPHPTSDENYPSHCMHQYFTPFIATFLRLSLPNLYLYPLLSFECVLQGPGIWNLVATVTILTGVPLNSNDIMKPLPLWVDWHHCLWGDAVWWETFSLSLLWARVQSLSFFSPRDNMVKWSSLNTGIFVFSAAFRTVQSELMIILHCPASGIMWQHE